ncbi:protein ccpA [Aspergillus thermomutatus]|uniref:Uncharacterized protein n=1 Tax=Aspergillus thermomutatus TaxID=41047 RepID=A0A397GTV8_ASPTH|nr:uncharacterized protein CDV56_105322 [Aspergillus thermomutatus]RHZ54461.1 hypothetical protein CDV56_105322 [Aspergillus thermomutatus]
MHFVQLVTVASALALAPTAVVARQAAAAFVTVTSLDDCPKGLAEEQGKSEPKKVTTAYTCERVTINHSLSYYAFDIEPVTPDTVSCCRAVKVYDNEDCLGYPALEIPIQGPLQDRCIPEHYLEDDVKHISFQLECTDQGEDERVEGEEHGPEQKGEHGPKQEGEPGSGKGEQDAEQEAPERKAGSPADSLGGLNSLTDLLGFRHTPIPLLLTGRVTVNKAQTASNGMEWNVSHQATNTAAARHHELDPECVIWRLSH